MIHALDHIVLAARDLDETIRAYEALLGRPCDGRSSGGGAAHGWFHLSNLSLVVAAPTGSGPRGDWIEAHLNTAGDGLAGLAFAVADLDRARSLAARRALPSTEPEPLDLPYSTSANPAVPVSVVSPAATHGVRLCLAERDHAAGQRASNSDSAITGLDHVVIRSPNPDRAVALYAGRLGLDLRLDRSNPAWGSRLLFFRCGDLVVEIAHDLKSGITDEPDVLWGLSWRAPDIDALQARLVVADIAVSAVRVGRRPGTRVFTVQDKAALVPTLVIGA